MTKSRQEVICFENGECQYNISVTFQSIKHILWVGWIWILWEHDTEGWKHQNTTSSFSRSTNAQSQVTTNTSCDVAIVGLFENKGRVQRVWVSLTRTFTHSARRELAYHYCKCCDVKRIFPLGSTQFHKQKCFTSGLHTDGKSLENSPCWCSIVSPVGSCGARHRGSLLSGAAGPLLQVVTPPPKHRRLLGLMYI